MILTTDQIYAYMRKVGFPGEVSTTMTAIALRESSGDPAAFNGNAATGDRSYGLLQINMMNASVSVFLKNKMPEVAIAETALLDPETNAEAGYLLWGHANSNLNIAWYINRPGAPNHYQERYEANLPAAQAAALRYSLPTTPTV